MAKTNCLCTRGLKPTLHITQACPIEQLEKEIEASEKLASELASAGNFIAASEERRRMRSRRMDLGYMPI